MDVSQVIKQAWDAVEKAGVPKEIQVAAFNAAVGLIAPVKTGDTIPKKTAIGSASDQLDAGDISEESIYAKVVGRTNVDRLELEKLVYLDVNEPKLVPNAIKGNMTTAESIRAIAQVLTIVRALGLEQQGTPLKMIKSECARLNRHDEKNFKKHIKSIENFAIVTKDKVEMLTARPLAFNSFPAVVDRLLGNPLKS